MLTDHLSVLGKIKLLKRYLWAYKATLGVMQKSTLWQDINLQEKKKQQCLQGVFPQCTEVISLKVCQCSTFRQSTS